MRVEEFKALDELRSREVNVFIAPRGICLTGTLVNHDDTSVVLCDSRGKTIVYKAQIISVTEADSDE